jgi:hypothetical protein
MAHTSGTSPVCLVQPNNQDKPNKPIRRDVRPGGVLEADGDRVCDRTDQG